MLATSPRLLDEAAGWSLLGEQSEDDNGGREGSCPVFPVCLPDQMSSDKAPGICPQWPDGHPHPPMWLWLQDDQSKLQFLPSRSEVRGAKWWTRMWLRDTALFGV